MIGSRQDVEHYIDDVIGTLHGCEDLREQVVRAMADLLIDYVGEQIESAFDSRMNWNEWIVGLWPHDDDFFDDVSDVIDSLRDQEDN
jgi:hypothetical protein